MGACLGVCSLLSCASCLLAQLSTSCVLCCYRSNLNSPISLLAFTFLLFLFWRLSLGSVLEWRHLYKLPCVCKGTLSTLGIQSHADYGSLLGHRSVYHMYFVLAAFFFLFTFLMIWVKNSKDPQAAIQNGFLVFEENMEPQNVVPE